MSNEDNKPSILELILDQIKETRSKVEDNDKRLGSIDVTLAKQNLTLEEHVKRSNLMEDRLVPVEKHVTMVNTVLKFIGFVGIVVALVEGLIQIFN